MVMQQYFGHLKTSSVYFVVLTCAKAIYAMKVCNKSLKLVAFGSGFMLFGHVTPGSNKYSSVVE